MFFKKNRTPQEHFPPARFLPRELHDKLWFDLDDPTALSVGDIIYDPHHGACYSGVVVEIVDWGIGVKWSKHYGNDKDMSHEAWAQLKGMWWVDPVMQEDIES